MISKTETSGDRIGPKKATWLICVTVGICLIDHFFPPPRANQSPLTAITLPTLAVHLTVSVVTPISKEVQEDYNPWNHLTQTWEANGFGTRVDQQTFIGDGQLTFCRESV